MGRRTPCSSGSSLWKEAWCLWTGQMGTSSGAQPSEGVDPCPLDNQGHVEGAL